MPVSVSLLPVPAPPFGSSAPALCPLPDVASGCSVVACGVGVGVVDDCDEGCVGVSVGLGVITGSLCRVSSVVSVGCTMSRTTESVPCPSVSARMMPAVAPTATSADTTATMMATRLLRALIGTWAPEACADEACDEETVRPMRAPPVSSRTVGIRWVLSVRSPASSVPSAVSPVCSSAGASPSWFCAASCSFLLDASMTFL